jgi:hypothetical protein
MGAFGVERSWIIPVILFIAVQQAVCLTLGTYHQFHGSPPYLPYGVAALTAFGLVAIFIGLIDARRMMRVQPPSPLAYMRNAFAARKERLIIFAFGCVLIWFQFVSLTWTKALIPYVTPMWADPMLADADAWIFGDDPWRLIHPIIMPIEPVVDVLYALWALILKVCLGAILFAPPSRNKSTLLLTFFLVMGLVGVFGQFILPSAGPIFWERMGLGNRFADFVPAAHAGWASDLLWEARAGDNLGFADGISAFPSMHVAGAVWMVLAMRLIYPKVQSLLWAYLVLVLVGSVALGWHYAMDGIGAAAGTILCFVLARFITSASFFQRPIPIPVFARPSIRNR